MFGVPPHDGPDAPPSIPGFEIIRQIGRGGQATVWLAHQRRPLNRRVAIKIFSARDAADDVVRRFQAEREALARLPSSGFCPIYEAGVARDARPYLVLEYVNGPSLLAACVSPEATAALAVSLLGRIARALAVAHRMGVLHLDLKPGNILVSAWPDPACEPRIIDFGLARDAGSRMPAAGTPGYAAPELVAGGEATAHCDIYSLGCIMHAVLDACGPLQRSTLAPAVRALAERCCAQSPDDRPRDAEEIAVHLHQMLSPRGSALWPAIAAAAIAILMIGAAVAFFRGGVLGERTGARQVGDYLCLDLSAHYNAAAAQLREGHALPAGLQNVDGVPLLFAAPDPGQSGARLCAISGAIGGGGSGDERRYVIPANAPSAQSVVLVMNTLWGSPGQELIDLEFDSGTHVQRVTLRHGRDVRDYLRGQLVEAGRANPAVRFGPEHELDAVTVELDPEFATDGLKTITIIDRGKNGVSRVLLFAASVRSG
jgi:hypothetical protein